MTDARLRLGPVKVKAADILERAYHALQAKDYLTCSRCLQQVLNRVPNHPMALVLMAMMATDSGRRTLEWDGETHNVLDAASEWVERALEMANPLPWPVANSFLALIRTRQGRYDDAVAAATLATEQDPGLFEAWNNLGNAYGSKGDYDAALRSYAKAWAIKPHNPSIRFNRAFIDLLHGRWEQGFQRYEARWQIPEWVRDHGRPFHKDRPQWFGKPIPGQRLLLHWEQGFGDTIMMARYLPWVLSRGPSLVILEVQRALLSLFRTSVTDDRIMVLGHGDPIPPFHYWCPMCSLPACHGTTQGKIPAPYPLQEAA